MSDTSKDRHVICYFGIINLCGIMDTKNSFGSGYSEVIMPLFSHESYTIKTTFNRNLEYKNTYMTDENGNVIYDEQGNPRHLKTDTFAMINVPNGENHPLKDYKGKYYQKKFRREVLWDFGDGTTKTGYSAEHSYKKPGRYKITCTFFDINRKAWVNDYSIYVVVKEVLPTILRFDTTKTKSEITCSKVERIAKIEALNSNTIKDDLVVNIKRIFNEEEHDGSYEEIGADYESLTPITFKFMEKYWTLLESNQVLFYNSDKVYSDDLKPTTTFNPKYNEIYGKFFYDDANDNMGVSLYQVIPYKNIDDDLKSIKILDPNTSILSHEVENWIEVPINHVYTDDQLPYDVFSVGKRGWFDVFYRNDFIGNPNVFSIFYEIESKNITGELESATNYLNVNPLGLTVNVKNNVLDNVHIGISLDGFLRPMEGEKISNTTYFIDQHLYNSLFRGIDIDVYIFPYIVYDDNTDIVVDDSMYYIPKDVCITLFPEVKTISGDKNYSFINHGGYIVDGEIAQYPKDDYILGIHDWFYRVPLILRKYINIKFKNTLNIVGQTTPTRQIDVNLVKKKLINPKSVIIPKEIQKKQDLNRFLDVYMSHPMFQDTPNLRDMLHAMLDNGYLTDILTSSENFLDNTANVKRCYLSNLISTLQMMGEDVTLFEKGAFEGVNDLKNFVRFLTMNHTELIGHVIDEELDITVRQDLRGKNVGEEVSLDDVLYLRDDATKNTLGKIYKIQTVDNGKTNTKLIGVDGGVDLIVHDRYTHDTKVVTFNGLQMSKYHKQKEEYEKEKAEGGTMPDFNPTLISEIKLSDYDESWGWNLLLPDSFTKIGKKIKAYKEKLVELGIKQEKMNKANARVRVYSLTQMNGLQEEIDKINREIKRLNDIRKGLVDGYYTFHLLNPKVGSKRIGNFIDNEYITQRLESTNDWNDVWGITHEILMKILLKNGDLFNNRGLDGDEDYTLHTTEINIKKDFSNKNDVTCNIISDGEPFTCPIRGILSITGDILDDGFNPLKISLSNGVIDERENFYMLSETVDLFIVDGEEIVENTHVFPIYGERVQGSITLTISGTVAQPQISVVANLEYNPIKLSGDILKTTNFEGKVYNNHVVVDDLLKGTANLSGYIKGTGNNTLTISFDNVVLSRNNGTSLFPVSVNGKEINVVVTNDGSITQKTDEFELTGTYDEGIFTGSIVTTVKGTVEKPIFIIEGDVQLQEYVNLLPEEYIQRTYTNNCSNLIQLLTSYNSKTIGENVSLPYYIDGLVVKLRKDQNSQMKVDITGEIISNMFKPDGYDFSWQARYKINTTDIPISIHPTTGEITKISIDLPIECEESSNNVINDGFICTIEGNMLQNNINVSLEEKSPLVGVYSVLFDLDRIYDKNSEDFAFVIQGFTEFDKVRVKMDTEAKQMIGGNYSNTITTPISVTLEYIKVIVVPEHEERDDDGNTTVIPETTYENVVFTNNTDVEFNGIVSVGDDGIISHEPIVITVDEEIDEFSSVNGSFSIVSGEKYEVTDFNFTHVVKVYLFYSGTEEMKNLLTNDVPEPYVVGGEYTITGGGEIQSETTQEIAFTSNYNIMLGYYDESSVVDESEDVEEEGDNFVVVSSFEGSFEDTRMVNDKGELQENISNFISHVDENEYGFEGHVNVSGGIGGQLDVCKDDLIYGYLPGEYDTTISISDFDIEGLTNKSKLTGELSIHGERVGNEYKYTIVDNDTVTYDGTKLTDSSNKEVTVQYGFDKQITSNGNTFTISYKDVDNYISLDGTFSINGEVKNTTITSSDLIFVDNSPVEVTLRFNDYGELIDGDLSGLVDGSELFSETHVGRITKEDGTWEILDFNYDLGSLEKGNGMFFKCQNLVKFSSPMGNLLGGNQMFVYCSNLTTFESDLTSLIDGRYMFQYCGLTSYRGKLRSLKSGYMMFKDCKLDAESLRNISKYINDISDLEKNIEEHWKFVYPIHNLNSTITSSHRGRIDIGLDKSISEDVIIECGNELKVKGWEVYFNDTEYVYTTPTSPYDISEANGWCPSAYNAGDDNWNNNVYKNIIEKGYVVEYVADGAAWGIKGTEN